MLHSLTRRPARRCVRGAVLPLFVLLLAAVGCTDAVDGQPCPPHSTLGTPSAPAATTMCRPSTTSAHTTGTSPGQPEAAVVETAVRDYFAAFERSDFAGLQARSVGELAVLPRWTRLLSTAYQGPDQLAPAAASIDSLTVTAISGQTATVRIRGQLEETTFDHTANRNTLVRSDITGPVTLTRAKTWQIADFHRNGGSTRAQIHAAQGQQTSEGITVRILGADLRPNGTILSLDVSNTTGLHAGATDPTIRQTTGRDHHNALGDIIILQTARRSTTSHAVYFRSPLPPDTTSFRFRVTYLLGCTPVCKVTANFDIPVQLLP